MFLETQINFENDVVPNDSMDVKSSSEVFSEVGSSLFLHWSEFWIRFLVHILQPCNFLSIKNSFCFFFKQQNRGLQLPLLVVGFQIFLHSGSCSREFK